jgi:hypothetical protein
LIFKVFPKHLNKRGFFLGYKMDKSKEKTKISKNLVIGIITVLVLVAVVWYVMSEQQTQENNELGSNSIQGITGNVVATVNGEEITSEEVVAVQQSFLQQGQQVSEEDAIEQMINQKVLYQKVQDEGISVTTEEVESVIEQQLAMQGATLEDFKQQIETQGASYQDQIQNIKNQIATQKYLENALEGQEFEVTEEEANEFYEMYKQQSSEEIPSYEELQPQIIATLEQQKQQEVVNSLVQKLKADADIKYF